MGMARYIFNNFITAESMITASSIKSGRVWPAVPAKSGNATMTPRGAYSGTSALVYVVKIDSVAAGNEIGQATFKWSDDGGVTWDTTGVGTSTSPTLLNNGVRITFAAGVGNDFKLNDLWRFRGALENGLNRLLDRNRNTVFKSGSLDDPNRLTINFSENKAPTVIIIDDHNLTSSATIVLEENGSDSWGSPSGSAAISWSQDRILVYLSSGSYQYNSLVISDQTNPDGFISIGNLFIGTYTELTVNFAYGYGRDKTPVEDIQTSSAGMENSRFYNWREMVSMNLYLLPAADITLLETMMEALGDKSTGKFNPLWFNEDSADTALFWLMKTGGLPRGYNNPNLKDVRMELREVVKTSA